MTLDIHIINQIKHNQHYGHSKKKNKKLDRLGIKSISRTRYVIDNTIFLNPVDVICEIKGSFTKVNNSISDSGNLLRAVYGQMKALTELSENGQIVITQKTYKDFKHTYEVFKNQSDTFLKVF